MNNTINTILADIANSPPKTAEERKILVDKLFSKFNGWFMQAENQDTMNRFERSIVKTYIAWQINEIINKN